MKNLDPQKQLEILSKSYVTAKDLYQLYPCGMTWARKTVNRIQDDLASKGIPLLETREKYVPLREVLKLYPVDENRLKKYGGADEDSR